MKISTKISLSIISVVIVSTVAILTAMLVQKASLRQKMGVLVREQGMHEADRVLQSIYETCVSSEKRNLKRLNHNLVIAREYLNRLGPMQFGDEKVTWQAVNQVTKETATVSLPKLMGGDTWFGQNFTTNSPSPLVDEVKHVTRDFVTVFQRMNDNGDMLRVCTSVLKDDGTRAVGTFIPRRNADGTENAVINTVLGGETYRGRAFVVNQWHVTAYEPIWDSKKEKIIGMLYVGIGMGDLNKELHDAVAKMVVGKSGYVFVVGSQGDERGRYIVSKDGKRDGESIWEVKDASGRLVIQSIVQKALQTSDGSLTNEFYGWQNKGESKPRTKFASITYFKPWDWVIGASAYEDDFNDMLRQADTSVNHLVWWVVAVSGCVVILGFAVGWLISRGIAKPINLAVEKQSTSANQVNAAANQVSSSSQTLAEGASEQAASLEETSSSLEEMASMTKRNSENAQKASELAKEARTAADKGASDMQSMSSAMEAIKVSSDDIAKIIKTIDEIAFQTNILALNAAVEAARAGEAGMGFAVVADEVRSLAQRSAQAAKETAAKIEGAIAKTGQGVEINAKVAQALNDIVTKVRQVDELVAEVSGASREQTQGITQINMAVGQMDKVTQNNAASAEESAAAAEELNAQAEIMKQSVVELLKLVGGGSQTTAVQTTASGQKKNTPPAMQVSKLSASGHGKGHVKAAPPVSRKEPVMAGASSLPLPDDNDFKDF